jgi:nucleotide-binding universal stress UspA family protein
MGGSAAVKPVRILLPIDLNGTTKACAAAAFGVAERLGMSVEVLQPCPAPDQRLPYATELSPLYFEELIEAGQKQVEQEKRQAKAWLDETAPAFPKVEVNFLALEGLVGRIVAARAKVADMTVLPSVAAEAAESDGLWATALDAALFRSGRPLLVAPNETAGPIGETVVIAWKDTVEAVRAVMAASRFLAKAKRVWLISVTEGTHDETADAMVDYLTRAGLHVDFEEIAPKRHEAGEVIVETATGKGVMLVMGAYGHWRWREWVFGGATEHVLRYATVPVLMTH